jgi:hypothetical protein
MRIFAFLMVLLFISATGFADDRKPEKKPRTLSESGEVKQQERKEPNDVRSKKRLTWPRPYKPTEEIRADTIVPFPADI